MSTFRKIAVATTIALAATGFAAVTHADDDIGPGEVVKLVQSGTIKSFDELNATAQALHPGATIDDTELELERGQYVYQVELRGTGFGEEWDVEIDAVTGAVLSDRQDD